MEVAVDWDDLRARAVDVAHRARAPYSRLQIGAAAIVDDGRHIEGCNVENASYGLTLCAECGLVSELARTGGGRLVAVAVRDSTGAPRMPCGRCRQLLWEAGGPDLLVDGSGDVQPMTAVLPGAFDASELPRR